MNLIHNKKNRTVYTSIFTLITLLLYISHANARPEPSSNFKCPLPDTMKLSDLVILDQIYERNWVKEGEKYRADLTPTTLNISYDPKTRTASVPRKDYFFKTKSDPEAWIVRVKHGNIVEMKKLFKKYGEIAPAEIKTLTTLKDVTLYLVRKVEPAEDGYYQVCDYRYTIPKLFNEPILRPTESLVGYGKYIPYPKEAPKKPS